MIVGTSAYLRTPSVPLNSDRHCIEKFLSTFLRILNSGSEKNGSSAGTPYRLLLCKVTERFQQPSQPG